MTFIVPDICVKTETVLWAPSAPAYLSLEAAIFGHTGPLSSPPLLRQIAPRSLVSSLGFSTDQVGPNRGPPMHTPSLLGQSDGHWARKQRLVDFGVWSPGP